MWSKFLEETEDGHGIQAIQRDIQTKEDMFTRGDEKVVFPEDDEEKHKTRKNEEWRRINSKHQWVSYIQISALTKLRFMIA